MLRTLTPAIEIQPDEYGAQIVWLSKLQKAGLDVASIVIISKEVFVRFLNEKILSDESIQTIHDLVRGELSDSFEIILKISTNKYNMGVLDGITISPTIESIKLGIEKCFQSWSSSKARAYRITESISATETYPALFLQLLPTQVFSLVSRSPRTGLPTGQLNLHNIHNTVSRLDNSHIKLLEQAEQVLGFPTKVYFSEDGSAKPIICWIEPEEMTDDAHWVALNDLFRKGSIDEIDLLTRIRPYMISTVTNYEVSIADGDRGNTELIRLKGVNGSPGRAVGKLVFTEAEESLFHYNERCVLCVTEYHPRDLAYLSRSAAALGSRGGATSHLATASRLLNIPAVVGLEDLDVQLKQRQVVKEGQVFPEGSYVFVDGFSGDVILSPHPLHPSLIARYQQKMQEENLAQLFDILRRTTADKQKFSAFPLDFQVHLSTLLQEFSKIGFSKREY